MLIWEKLISENYVNIYQRKRQESERVKKTRPICFKMTNKTIGFSKEIYVGDTWQRNESTVIKCCSGEKKRERQTKPPAGIIIIYSEGEKKVFVRFYDFIIEAGNRIRNGKRRPKNRGKPLRKRIFISQVVMGDSYYMDLYI